ncbi:hypothetical protein C8F04DRAFT_1173302 [Mycena alexandri]|uniref:Uncharacterized protein n=1 Tax=Mycena alexandri TaxID=1745969 RepID=A0AAD6XIJ7_9AGAR|nr:hypothetical protein C8F04DRAFT_1173302 [Mycena alexandri]
MAVSSTLGQQFGACIATEKDNQGWMNAATEQEGSKKEASLIRFDGQRCAQTAPLSGPNMAMLSRYFWAQVAVLANFDSMLLDTAKRYPQKKSPTLGPRFAACRLYLPSIGAMGVRCASASRVRARGSAGGGAGGRVRTLVRVRARLCAVGPNTMYVVPKLCPLDQTCAHPAQTSSAGAVVGQVGFIQDNAWICGWLGCLLVLTIVFQVYDRDDLCSYFMMNSCYPPPRSIYPLWSRGERPLTQPVGWWIGHRLGVD